jgi:hypothetical protein
MRLLLVKIRALVKAIAAIAVALLSAAIIYKLLVYAQRPIEAWYFSKHVASSDPDPTWPPLMWLDLVVFPLVTVTIGGIIAAYIYKHKSSLYAIFVGITFGLAWLLTFPNLSHFDLVFIGFSVIIVLSGFIGCYIGQQMLNRNN